MEFDPALTLRIAVAILLIAVCPLSMMFMMRSMQSNHHRTPPQRGDGGGPAASREEQIENLKSQLEDTRGRQETIAQEIARLEASSEDNHFRAS